MYEKIAWNNFIKTGNIESFLEYKRLSNMQIINNSINENIGALLNEINKDKGDSNKRNIL